MTKEKAQARIAAILAGNTYEHMVAAKRDPNLKENTLEAVATNRAACEAFGFAEQYDGALSLFGLI